jgi:hypothetical protein
MHCNNKAFNHGSMMTSVILPDQIVQVPRARQRLPIVVAKLVIQELLVVAGSAYAASVIYQGAMLMTWSSAEPSSWR